MIQLIGEDARSVPDWFKRGLKHIDSALVCYFNPFKRNFCVDRCVKGSDCLSSDHISCEKTNVHTFEHMSENVLDTLKGMDAWSNFGGNNEDALLRFRRKHEIAKEEFDAANKAAIRDNYRLGMLDDRAQINKALHLIQQHDVARVNQ